MTRLGLEQLDLQVTWVGPGGDTVMWIALAAAVLGAAVLGRSWKDGVEPSPYMAIVLMVLPLVGGGVLMLFGDDPEGLLFAVAPWPLLRARAIAAGAVLLACLSLFLSPFGKTRAPLWFFPLPILALLGTWFGLGQQRAAYDAELDRLWVSAPEWVHAGQTPPIDVRATEGWDVSLEGAPEGSVYRAKALLYQGPWLAELTVSVPLREDRSDPRFPVATGNSWRWRMVETKGNPGGLWIFDGQPEVTETGEEIVLQILDPVMENGQTRYRAELRGGDGVETLWLVGADGLTYVSDAPDGDLQLALVMKDQPGAFGAETARCDLPALGWQACRCSAAPGGSMAYPTGPLRCTLDSDYSLATAVTRGAIAIMSLGLLDTGHNYEEVGVELVQTQPAPVPTAADWVFAWLRRAQDLTSDRAMDRLRSQAAPLDVEAAAAILLYFAHDSERREALDILWPHVTGERERLRGLVGTPSTP